MINPFKRLVINRHSYSPKDSGAVRYDEAQVLSDEEKALARSNIGAGSGGGGGNVDSVNGQTGVVVLDAEDVGALPDSYVAPVQSVNGQTGIISLDAEDVGALPDSYVAPVQSVNGQSGVVVLDAEDVGALPDDYSPPTEIEYISTTFTFAQVASVIASGKLPVLKVSSSYYHYIGIISNQPTFARISASTTGTTVYQYSCASNNTWNLTSRTLAPIASPTFTGSPATTTPAISNNGTRIASTAFVHSLIDSKGYVDASGAADAAPVQSVNGMTGDVVISGGGAVDSVNGQTGTVVLDADDVGALPDTYVAPVQSVNGQTGNVSLSIPSKTSDLTNDSGFVNSAGAASAAPVQSVNGQTGNVVISAGGSLDLLWTNQSPTSNFGTQTISLDLSTYQMVVIVFNINAAASHQVTAIIMRDTSMVVVGEAETSSTTYKRLSAVSSTGVTFNGGYRSTSANDGAMIPIKIYGIKF